MKKNKNLLIIILILVVLISAIVIFVTKEAEEGPIIENNNGTSSPATNTPEETVGFSEVGNIMINNPGFEKGSFYLSYGKPGQVGLSEKLIFDEDSVCIKSEELNCKELISKINKEDWSGKRKSSANLLPQALSRIFCRWWTIWNWPWNTPGTTRPARAFAKAWK